VNTTTGAGQTPLLLATEDGNFRTACISIRYGTDFTRRNEIGRTSAIRGFTNHHPAMVHYLVSQGAPDNFPRQVDTYFANRILETDAGQQAAAKILISVCVLNWTGDKYGMKIERSETWGGENRSADGARLDWDGSAESIVTQHGLLSRITNRPREGFYRTWSEAMEEGARCRAERDSTSGESWNDEQWIFAAHSYLIL
jgi:hypothetical protein